MPAPLRIILSKLESFTLRELREAEAVPKRTRARAHMLLLNSQGGNAPAIAKIFDCHQHTVRRTIVQWETRGLVGLWEEEGRGAKTKWQESDIEYLIECLEKEPRTYNSKQLAQKLKAERSVDLSSDRVRRLLKKKLSLEKNT